MAIDYHMSVCEGCCCDKSDVVKRANTILLHDGKPKTNYKTETAEHFDCVAWAQLYDTWIRSFTGVMVTIRAVIMRSKWLQRTENKFSFLPKKGQEWRACAQKSRTYPGVERGDPTNQEKEKGMASTAWRRPYRVPQIHDSSCEKALEAKKVNQQKPV